MCRTSSQAASPFPGWEGEAEHDGDEEHYEYGEERAGAGGG